jgi:hypothetical protein
MITTLILRDDLVRKAPEPTEKADPAISTSRTVEKHRI